MRRARRSIEHKVQIDGNELIWWLHREQHFDPVEGWRGVAIHVRAAEGVHRELYLEYPAVQPHKVGFIRSDHAVVNIRAAKVEEHIRLAMEWGWDPEGRGKPYRYDVQELPY